MLTVKEYEARENEAAAALPDRIVEMVNPVVFASEGYPTRVRNDSELWKYLDVMHETRFERDFATLFGGGMTEREFALLQRAARLSCDFSNECFKRNLATRGSLLRALNVYRHIRDIFNGAPARVFEIGPGSGYLRCLFILDGWSYGGSDITQAFYLFQNRLWNYASRGGLKDLADDPNWAGEFSPDHPVHIPWWEFFRLLDRGIPCVDVVTCNHALAEMHPHSLAFALRIAHEMLRGEGVKAFVFEGWGFEKFVPRSTITKLFYRSGYCLIHNDSKITVFAPRDSACASPSALWPRIAHRRKPASGKKPDGVIQERRTWELLGTYSDLKAMAGSLVFLSGVRQFMRSLSYWPARVSLPRNTISQRILKGREQRRKERLIGLEQVNRFYAELLKTPDLLTPDERFLGFIDTSL